MYLDIDADSTNCTTSQPIPGNEYAAKHFTIYSEWYNEERITSYLTSRIVLTSMRERTFALRPRVNAGKANVNMQIHLKHLVQDVGDGPCDSIEKQLQKWNQRYLNKSRPISNEKKQACNNFWNLSPKDCFILNLEGLRLDIAKHPDSFDQRLSFSL